MRLNYARDWFYLLVGGDWVLGTIADPKWYGGIGGAETRLYLHAFI